MIDVYGKYKCPSCGIRDRVIKVKFDKRTKKRVIHQKRGFYWVLICPLDGSEVQEVKKELKKIFPKIESAKEFLEQFEVVCFKCDEEPTMKIYDDSIRKDDSERLPLRFDCPNDKCQNSIFIFWK